MLYSQEKLERPSTKGYLYSKPTQCRKVKEVGDLITGEPATEAPVNGGRNYNSPKVAKFLVGLGGRRRRPPFGGPEPSVRYHSGRARILTLCQDLRAKGQSQSLSVACFGPLPHYVEKVSHRFRYKILSLPPGQLDTQPLGHTGLEPETSPVK
ncbi:hypothetical protein V6N13_020955 [Hibiscus sabdariffa]